MSEEFIVGVLEGALYRVKDRIERDGGKVVDLENFGGTLRVTGKSRRELLATPGVRFVEDGSSRLKRGL